MSVVRIPLKSFLHKYLSKSWGTAPLALQKNDKLHREIFRAIQVFAPENLSKNEHQHFLAIELTDFLLAKKRIYVSQAAANRLNKLFIGMMYAEFYAYMNAASEQKLIEKIYAFMDMYDINEDEVKADTLKRSYHRYRQQFISDKNAAKLSEADSVPFLSFFEQTA